MNHMKKNKQGKTLLKITTPRCEPNNIMLVLVSNVLYAEWHVELGEAAISLH